MHTQAGIILGTAVYMSPEQAKGRPADKRSDIWAFGCVVFEMLTGKRAFDGEDLTDVVAAVIRGEPDWKAMPPDVPAHVLTLVKGCLEKDRKARIGDIAVARFLLEQGSTLQAARVAIGTDKPSRSRATIAWGAAAVVALVASGVSMMIRWPLSVTPSPVGPIRLTAEVGANISLLTQASGSVALSPDGARLAFIGSPAAGTNPSLYVRRLDQLQASPVAGTEGGFSPFFSPDGEWIAYFGQGKLRKVAAGGSAPVTLCDAPNGRGASWSEDGWIYFTPDSGLNQGIKRVRAEGGTPEDVVKPEKEGLLRWVQVLPGSKALLFTEPPTTGSYDTAKVVAFSLADRTRKVVVEGGYQAHYVPSGHIIYLKEGTLFAAPFDPVALEVRGGAVPAIQGVATNTTTGGAQFAVSNNGMIVYVAGETTADKAPIRWIDRTGKTEMLRSPVADWSNPSFSPDGRRLAMDILDGTQTDIWVYEWARDTLSRLTFDRANDVRPVWSPTGRHIAYSSQRSGAPNLYLQRSDGTGDVVRLTESQNPQWPSSWHPSGKYLAFFETVPGKATDLMILPLEGDEAAGWKPGKPQAFLATSFVESSGMFSPDGRWMAYLSNESGRNEVFVRPFPGPGGKWQISTAPGDDPTWSRVSNEFFFLDTSDSRMMSVPYRVDGDSFQADKPRVWLDARVSGRPRPPSRDLDLHPDGKRFVIGSSDEQSPDFRNHVVLIFHFSDELRRTAPVKDRQ
jgi:serine/threonine-protein kinase